MSDSRQRLDANRTAFERMIAADPVLVDVQPAVDVIPGMTPTTILTSGPPLDWPDYVGKFDRLSENLIENNQRDRFIALAERLDQASAADILQLNPVLSEGTVDEGSNRRGIFDYS